MRKSRLLELFKSLEKTEVKRLRKWVRSPYFNQREDVISLFDYLDKNRPLEQPEKLDRTYIFSQIFPNENYDEKKIGYAQSFLLSEIKKFIAYEAFAADEIRPQIHLTRSLRNRGLHRLFESEWKNVNTLLQKQPLRNADYHFHQFQLQSEQYEYSISSSRNQPKGLQEASNELTNYFMVMKLKQGCDQLSHQNLISTEYEQDFLDSVLTFLKEKETSEVTAVQIYFQSFKILSDSTSTIHYEEFRKLLKQNQTIFSKAELKYLYLVGINYCIRQMNASRKDFDKKIFELYKEGLELEIFLTNGILSRFTYKNIVSVGINIREFDWVKSFIYEYKSKIETAWREPSFTFNLATLFYKMSDYDSAMELLQKTEFKDVFLNLNSRKILIKIYFELSEFNALNSLLDSFTRYLNRRKELGYHKNLHLDFIRVVKKLLQLPKYNHTGRKELREELEGKEKIIEKKWLLEQLG